MKLTTQERERFINENIDMSKYPEMSLEEMGVALFALRNNVPEYKERIKAERKEKRERRIKRAIEWILLILAFIAMILLNSCKAHYTNEYKVVTKDGNFYVDEITRSNDSIFLKELLRDGTVRRTGKFLESETTILKSN